MKIQIPNYVQKILGGLTNAGFEAYVVGGCIRDVLMGKIPNDWDVCTSASPIEICKCFEEFKTIDIGKDYGTIIVISESKPVEVTTYRIDGKYRDSRHPESVTFTSNLKEDLARRDFTMNAIAYSPDIGLQDYFEGKKAIEEKKIIAVGNPEKRFEEDALRMMRGMRFSSVLNFEIEKNTENALIKKADIIKTISPERIQSELNKLIMGNNVDRILQRYKVLLEDNIEGLKAAPISHLPNSISCRLAAIFPKDTKTYLKKLRYDNKTINLSETLNRIDRENVGNEKKDILNLLKKYGVEPVQLWYESRDMKAEFTEVLGENPCFNLRHLAIDGTFLIERGVSPGPEVGRILSLLLDKVIEGEIENNKEQLLGVLKKEELI